jgi:galactose-1-phosphate uridylyltransferase
MSDDYTADLPIQLLAILAYDHFKGVALSFGVGQQRDYMSFVVFFHFIL